LHLLGGRHTGEAVRDALVAPLPASQRRSLTWDQGKELALHPEVAHVLSMPVFLCDPHSPWQRPSNENRLLRQYFRKGSDLRVHGPEQLVAVAAELNARPCKTLGWDTPTGRLAANKHGDQPGSPSSGPASTTGQALRG
jgi:transposase, IS30 family